MTPTRIAAGAVVVTAATATLTAFTTHAPATAADDQVRAAGPMTALGAGYDDAEARVHAVTTGSGRTVVTLHVSGLPGERVYGAHVHVGSCAQAGLGHYMHAGEAGATPDNEVWLDVAVNAAGHGSAQSVVDWTFRQDPAEGSVARSVVVHAQPTAPNGTAGQKLACLDVDF